MITRIFTADGREVTNEVLYPGVTYWLSWREPSPRAELRRMHTEYHRRRR